MDAQLFTLSMYSIYSIYIYVNEANFFFLFLSFLYHTVRTVQDAVRLLELGGADGAGLKMSDSEKVSLVTNLLTVTCAEGDAQPTVPLR